MDRLRIALAMTPGTAIIYDEKILIARHLLAESARDAKVAYPCRNTPGPPACMRSDRMVEFSEVRVCSSLRVSERALDE